MFCISHDCSLIFAPDFRWVMANKSCYFSQGLGRCPPISEATDPDNIWPFAKEEKQQTKSLFKKYK
jgi:hypothetical protein